MTPAHDITPLDWRYEFWYTTIRSTSLETLSFKYCGSTLSWVTMNHSQISFIFTIQNGNVSAKATRWRMSWPSVAWVSCLPEGLKGVSIAKQKQTLMEGLGMSSQFHRVCSLVSETFWHFRKDSFDAFPKWICGCWKPFIITASNLMVRRFLLFPRTCWCVVSNYVKQHIWKKHVNIHIWYIYHW